MLKGLIMKRLATAFAIATVLAFGMQAAGAQTLKAVKDRGQLQCGANGSLAGFDCQSVKTRVTCPILRPGRMSRLP